MDAVHRQRFSAMRKQPMFRKGVLQHEIKLGCGAAEH